jgi:hypothetical protein
MRKRIKGIDLINYLVMGAFVVFMIVVIHACNTAKNKSSQINQLSFQKYIIADSLVNFWARFPADVTGDGIEDLVFIHENAYGGYLGYFEGNVDTTTLWKKHVIADTAPNGGTFASGDLECADVDFDGDMDVIAVQHTGEWEWDAPNRTSVIFWYENKYPEWKAHLIGEAPDFIKDISVTDFNNDSRMDIAVLTYKKHSLSIFQQKQKDNWERIQYYQDYKDLHEGMDVGDVNGDGRIDIVANAYVFYNPGNNLRNTWEVENIDPKWNTQEGDWSRNATKIVVHDVNRDDKAEVFISHSERAGYPLAMYQRQDNGKWKESIIKDSIPACHTLQINDFDNDGYYDILAGINKARAKDLNMKDFYVTIFRGQNEYQVWEPMIIENTGIYNGLVSDYDRDGDFDIFCHPAHNAEELYMLENNVIDNDDNNQ